MSVPDVSFADYGAAASGTDEFVSVESKTADYTVNADDGGKLFTSGAADLVFTLPSAATAGVGFTVSFQAQTLSTTTGISISPAAADNIYGNALTAVDDKDLINTAATDAKGDMVTLRSDGTDWCITRVLGTWAKEA